MAEAFTKILNLRENEKQIAHKAYLKSQEAFEEKATRLYHLLKRKEDAEQTYGRYIETSSTLQKIKEQVAYIEKLNSEIIFLEKEVQFARNQMNKKQAVLNDAYIEVKKYETIIQKRKNDAAEKAAKAEMAFMDEISMNQYFSYKN